MKPNGKIKRVIVLGAGTVGRYITRLLQNEQVEVTLIDKDKALLDEVSDTLDVLTVHGNGANPAVLHQAGIADAQLLLAFTNSCEVNMLAAFVANQMGAIRTVARTRAAWTMDATHVDLRAGLGVDLLMNPEMLTAIEIVKFLENPDSLSMEHYARGKVQLRQFVLDAKSPFNGQMLKDCKVPSGILVVTRVRAGEVIIPRGEDDLQSGDRITIVGLPNNLQEAARNFHAPATAIRKVTIAGGGNSGRYLAQTLEERHFSVRLVEPDSERCDYLGERLRHTNIIRADATQLEIMQEERIGDSHVFIAVMADDEDNLMACLLAKELGVKQTIARVQRPDYASLVQRMGVDLALSPRHVVANHVMTMIAGGKIRAVSLMEEGRVQVVEYVAEQDSPITASPLIDITLPRNTILSAIVRKSRVIIPRGKDQVRPGDTVIMVGLRESMEAVEKLFERD